MRRSIEGFAASPRALGFGLWALGFGLWASGFGLRASGGSKRGVAKSAEVIAEAWGLSAMLEPLSRMARD